MNRYLPFALIALVAAVALGSGTAIYRSKDARIEADAAAAAELASQPTNGKPGAKSPHIRGAAKAAVTIEEFADFQCPPCGTLSGVLKNLEKAYAGKVRMVFRHYPLQNHVHARQAALTAEAAGLQGKFWEMHDLLYQHRAAWAAAPSLRPFIDSYAQSLGLDLARFANDLEGEQTKARVAADRERADSLGVDRTPSVFINQRPIPFSSFDEAGLRKEIDALLNVQTPQ